MKASTLIKELINHTDIYGDCDVEVWDCNSDLSVDVQDIGSADYGDKLNFVIWINSDIK